VAISRALEEARRRAAAGDRDPRDLAAGITRAVLAAGMRVDYAELVHPETLRPVLRAEPGTRALVAAFLGRTRLIDNVALP
ncbi:MAG: pantoate--beta-alanine ligase, partial [Deltaproteobacteria bacterium]|nr:pantoate--beta-alanine ligase [Deltaproteobacteria bacterium]